MRRLLCWMGFHVPDKWNKFTFDSPKTLGGYMWYRRCFYCGDCDFGYHVTREESWEVK